MSNQKRRRRTTCIATVPATSCARTRRASPHTNTVTGNSTAPIGRTSWIATISHHLRPVTPVTRDLRPRLAACHGPRCIGPEITFGQSYYPSWALWRLCYKPGGTPMFMTREHTQVAEENPVVCRKIPGIFLLSNWFLDS